MTTVNIADMPVSAQSGNPRRRVMIFITGTATSKTHSENLTIHVPELSDIEGVFLNTRDNVTNATVLTWSTTTLTYAGSPDVLEVGVIGVIT